MRGNEADDICFVEEAKNIIGASNEGSELFFTGPMTLSHETFSEIRKELADLLARVTKMIEPSKAEVLACMNFDLFKV